MENNEIIAAAVAELKQPTNGVTEQFLGIHQIASEDDKPRVAGSIISDDQKRAAVYFTVEGEKFYFVVYLGLGPEIIVTGVDTEDFYEIFFLATSEKRDAKQLATLTTLKPTKLWEKGDIRYGCTRWKYSGIKFEPYTKPDTFESKLGKLLSFLEQDAAGVCTLVNEAEGFIQVVAIFHNGNTWLGGVHLDKEVVRRLAALYLEIDFALYAKGNSFKS